MAGTEKPLAEVLDALPDVAVVLLDADCRVLHLNRAAASLYGSAAADAVGRSWPLHPVEGLDLRLAAASAALEGVCRFEQKRRGPDGSRFTASCALTPLPPGFVEVSRDIDMQARELRYLRESEARLSRILRESGDGLLVFSPDGRLQFLNDAARSYLALPGGTTLGASYSNIRIAAAGALPFLRVVRTGEPCEERRDLRPLGGALVHLRAVPLHSGGELDAVVIHVRDITAPTEAARHEESAAAMHRLARGLLAAQESERRRLARELHDELGQQLTGCLMRLQRAGIEDPEVLDPVRAAIDRVRGLSLELRPAILDDLGVLPALLWLADRLRASAGLEVEVRHRGMNRRFAAEIETALYRLTQEALTNVIRHSGVPRAVVRLECSGSSIELAVTDEGSGCPAENLGKVDSGGLGGMRERVALLGGDFHVRSNPGEGTVVEVTLPLE